MATAVTAPLDAGHDDITELIDERIRQAKDERRTLDREYREARRDVDRRVQQLEASRRDLRRRARLSGDAPKDFEPATMAGKKNVDAARKAIRKLGRATQAHIGRTAGVPTGSLTWAIRALEKEGTIRATGVKERSSAEYELVARPGRKRIRPGE